MYMFANKFNINHRFNTVNLLQHISINPAVTEKAEMYKNGPSSLGRGHQIGPRSPFCIFYELNELEELTEESTVSKLGRERKKWAEITGSRSLKWAEVIGPKSPWAEVTCIWCVESNEITRHVPNRADVRVGVFCTSSGEM